MSYNLDTAEFYKLINKIWKSKVCKFLKQLDEYMFLSKYSAPLSVVGHFSSNG